jgi:hypothetical protein
LIDSIQKRQSIAGNVFEIGVHHGKSALVLAAMTRPSETLGVCDIFGSQGLNESRSGRGDREIFMAHFNDAFPGYSRLRVYEKLSTALTPEEVGGCRFLHVDGGHSTAEALADLELCARCLVPGGVIALDDAFNSSWPGVTEAVFEFLRRHSNMVPLVVGFNKMLLVDAAWRESYSRVFDVPSEYRRYVPRRPYSMKLVELVNCPTYVFYVHSSRSEKSVSTWLHRLKLAHPSLGTGPVGALWRGFRGVSRIVGLTK